MLAQVWFIPSVAFLFDIQSERFRRKPNPEARTVPRWWAGRGGNRAQRNLGPGNSVLAGSIHMEKPLIASVASGLLTLLILAAPSARAQYVV
jgi:hypothetical protein